MQGPIGDAFNSRFLAVDGEGDLPLAGAELDAIRNPPSRLMIHGEFPLKSAARVTAADITDYNLILFGTGMMPLSLLPDCFVAKEGRVTTAGHFDRGWK